MDWCGRKEVGGVCEGVGGGGGEIYSPSPGDERPPASATDAPPVPTGSHVAVQGGAPGGVGGHEELVLPAVSTDPPGAFVFDLADDHRPYTLRRWPMGLVPAPALAQAVMEELVMVGVGGRCDTMTYVDDVALVEPTDEDVKALVEGAKAMGAEIGKCGDSAVTGSFVWVGIEWRVGGDFRPAEKLTGKLLARGPGGGDGRGQID